MPARLSRDEQIQRMTRVHDGYYSYERWGHPLATEKSIITCPVHGDFQQSYHNHRKEHGCPICGDIKGQKKRKPKMREYFDDPTYRKNMSKTMKKVWENQDYRESLFKIHQSPEFKEKMSQIMSDRWQDPEYQELMSSQSRESMLKLWQDPDYRAYMEKMLKSPERRSLVSSSGPSKGVKAIVKFLKKKKIRYQGGEDQANEFRIPDTLYRFDFYLPDHNLFIEFHGEQHYKGWGGKKKNLEKKQYNDQWKANWALENGYQLLVISYRDRRRIPAILSGALNL